jgi:hypothetical protein
VTSADVRLTFGNTHRETVATNLRRAWILKRESCHRCERLMIESRCINFLDHRAWLPLNRFFLTAG